MNIGIDLDSTLNNLDEVWAAWIQEHHDPSFDREKWVSWDLHEHTPAGKAIYDFLDIPGSFLNLGIQPGAREVIQDILEAGHQVYIPTACYLRPGREHVLADKVRWMECHLPELDMHNLIVIQDKFLLHGLALLIDDGAHNLDKFPNKKLLFDAPWNRGSTHARAVGWAGVRAWLLERGVF